MKESDFDFLNEQQQKELVYLGYTILKGYPKAQLKELMRETNEFVKEVKQKNHPCRVVLKYLITTII